jgi:hypothetical protein
VLGELDHVHLVMSTRRGGTVVQTGLHVGPADVRPMVWSENDLTIAGAWCYHVYDWRRIAAIIERRSFPVEGIVTSHVDLEEAAPKGFVVLVDPRQRDQDPGRGSLTASGIAALRSCAAMRTGELLAPKPR